MLLTEPKTRTLASTLNVLRRETSKLLKGDRKQFWQARYYDFNVLTHAKFVENSATSIEIQFPEASPPPGRLALEQLLPLADR